MSRENPLWGAPRIHGELLKLGIDVGETSVGKYLVRGRKPPSQTWRTFLENHVKTLVSIDFFTVPTIRFQILYVFLVLAHDRRRILHFGVTAHPTAEWTAQQLREAFPWDAAPRYLLRDRDRIFGDEFKKQVKDMGIQEVLSAPRSPWQRAYIERLIGTLRRSGPHDRLQRSLTVPACEVIHGVLSRIQSAPLAGQGHAGTAARAPAGSGTRGSDTASWRPSSPVRAARGLNVGVLAAIPLRNAVPILSGRYDMTIRSANRSEDFGLLPCSRGTVERAPDLPAFMCHPRPLSDGIIVRHSRSHSASHQMKMGLGPIGRSPCA